MQVSDVGVCMYHMHILYLNLRYVRNTFAKPVFDHKWEAYEYYYLELLFGPFNTFVEVCIYIHICNLRKLFAIVRSQICIFHE